MKPRQVSGPQYLQDGRIICNVVWSGQERYGAAPFVADPNDIEQHGRQLHADLKSGKYGAIAPAEEE